jgi:3-deoxy-manno-octulosonate cytidylyltransferase (CMP-KDO synthetase)
MNTLGSNSFIVIPARLASTRLPRKLLLRETGKTVLQHTWEAASQARLPRGVVVAADAAEIAAAVEAFGGQVVMTDPACASGTDRVAEVARSLPDVAIFVNVQGDEPELPPAAIDKVIEMLHQDSAAVMATLATPIRQKEKLHDPSCVKVVCNEHQHALYFSRAPIPFVRDWDDAWLTADPPCFLQHIGLYAYRREFLLQLAELPRSVPERLENLEQLRVLSAGLPIVVGVIDEPLRGIDTPADYEAFVRRVQAR